VQSAGTNNGGLRQRGGRLVRGLARTRAGKSVLDVALKDDVLFWTTRHLANRASLEARFESSLPSGLDRVEGFEDVAWLFSQNELHHGLARLRIEEAAYFWKLLKTYDRPRAAEVGRFRGGTAFLFAAAGADVLTLDNDAARSAEDTPSLELALEQCGLRDRVEIVVADGRTHSVEPASFDVVFIDALQTYDGARALFDHWWPTLTPGGHLFLRNVTEGDPSAAEVRRVAEEVGQRPGVERVGTIGQCAHFRRRPEEVP
jgi:predicted O-methyltransferase YrrM